MELSVKLLKFGVPLHLLMALVGGGGLLLGLLLGGALAAWCWFRNKVISRACYYSLFLLNLKQYHVFVLGLIFFSLLLFSWQVVKMDEEEELEEDNLEPVNGNNKDPETGKKDIL